MPTVGTTPPSSWIGLLSIPHRRGPASDPPDTTVSTEGANQTITSEESCDASGNCATGTVTVSIDVTAPMLTIGAPTEVVLGDTINITCAATDALSGIVTGCVGVSEPAAAVGPWVFTFTGTDRAGNQTTETVTVSVLAPANTAPVVNADMGVPGLQEIGFRTGAVVVLGSFTDAENNGPYTATMRWSAGGSFTRTVLVGNRRITAGEVYFGSVSRTATLRICDAAGLCGTDDITIRPNVTVRVAPRVCVVDRANLVAPRYEARWGFTNPASYAIAVGSLPQHRHSEDQLPPLHLTPAATAPIVDGKTSVGHTESRVHPPGSIERPLELERQAVVSPR